MKMRSYIVETKKERVSERENERKISSEPIM